MLLNCEPSLYPKFRITSRPFSMLFSKPATSCLEWVRVLVLPNLEQCYIGKAASSQGLFNFFLTFFPAAFSAMHRMGGRRNSESFAFRFVFRPKPARYWRIVLSIRTANFPRIGTLWLSSAPARLSSAPNSGLVTIEIYKLFVINCLQLISTCRGFLQFKICHENVTQM